VKKSSITFAKDSLPDTQTCIRDVFGWPVLSRCFYFLHLLKITRKLALYNKELTWMTYGTLFSSW